MEADEINDVTDLHEDLIDVRDLIDLAGKLGQIEDPEVRAEVAEALEDLPGQLGAKELAGAEGQILVAEDHFLDYAKDFAENCGAIEDSSRWPCDFIDWDGAAASLRMDFRAVTFADRPYLARP